jgi:hypothetical protein
MNILFWRVCTSPDCPRPCAPARPLAPASDIRRTGQTLKELENSQRTVVEMAAEAVEDAGIEPLMARATAARLRWKEQLGLKDHFNGVVPANYQMAIEAIAAKMKTRKST